MTDEGQSDNARHDTADTPAHDKAVVNYNEIQHTREVDGSTPRSWRVLERLNAYLAMAQRRHVSSIRVPVADLSVIRNVIQAAADVFHPLKNSVVAIKALRSALERQE